MFYALKRGKYPIDTVDQVKLAEQYFSKYVNQFDILDRIEFSTSLEKRAEQLNQVIDSEIVHNYAKVANINTPISTGFKKSIEMRKVACVRAKKTILGANACDMLDKIAGLATDNPNLVVLHALLEFDKLANFQSAYNSEIPDPVLSVYGVDPSHENISDYVKLASSDLRRVANNKNKMQKVASVFGDKFAKEYAANPVFAFKKLAAIDQVTFEEKVV